MQKSYVGSKLHEPEEKITSQIYHAALCTSAQSITLTQVHFIKQVDFLLVTKTVSSQPLQYPLLRDSGCSATQTAVETRRQHTVRCNT